MRITIDPVHKRTLESIFVVLFAFGIALITCIGMESHMVLGNGSCDKSIDGKLTNLRSLPNQYWYSNLLLSASSRLWKMHGVDLAFFVPLLLFVDVVLSLYNTSRFVLSTLGADTVPLDILCSWSNTE